MGPAGPVFYFSTTDSSGQIVIATNAAPAAVEPAGLSVDPAAGPGSDGNGVFEPGETVSIDPSWENTGASPVVLSGTASAFDGPSGPTYAVVDDTADYGVVPSGGTHSCDSGPDCYSLFVSAPATRPATHWDVTFVETLNTSTIKTWTLHIGDSFTDVPRSNLFYKNVETILHKGITVGCTATEYCPADQVPRSQKAMFIARGLLAGSLIPASGSVNGHPYDCTAGGASLFSDVAPTDIFCRAVHYMYGKGITSGCNTSLYCPTQSITRTEIAIFIAKAVVAAAGGATVPMTYGPDPVTGFSYSCDAASPNLHFTDIATSDNFCKHAHFLWAKGIIAGCSPTLYCPALNTGRDEMAKFLSNAFSLVLYGP